MIQVPEYVQKVLAALEAAGFRACPVGGCVRDCLLGKEPADWDVCTDARPQQTVSALCAYRCLLVGARHGTVTALTEGGPVEVTTFRTEGDYADGRHPDCVTYVTRVEEDLARRDFTINAMALGPDGRVIDPYGGQKDLAAGVIRCVGDPARRFEEDGLRILRALRFASRLDFVLEESTACALTDGRALLENVSPERSFGELQGILAGPGAGRTLRTFAPVFFRLIPELSPEDGFDQHSPYHIHDVWTHTTLAVDAVPSRPELRLTMLLHDIGKPETFTLDENGVGHFRGHAEAGAARAEAILRRLRCDNAARETVTTLIRYHAIEPPQTPRAMGRLCRRLGEAAVRDLFACWRADQSDRAPDVRARNLAVIGRAEEMLDGLSGEEKTFSLKALAVNGRDVLALGAEEGPSVGRVLAELFRLVAEGELPNDRALLLQKTAELLAHEEK